MSKTAHHRERALMRERGVTGKDILARDVRQIMSGRISHGTPIRQGRACSPIPDMGIK